MRTEATVKIVIEMTGEEFEKLREGKEDEWNRLKSLIVKDTVKFNGNALIDPNFTL